MGGRSASAGGRPGCGRRPRKSTNGTTAAKIHTRQLVVSVLFLVALIAVIAFSSRVVAFVDGLLPGGFLLSLFGQAALAGVCWLAVLWQLPDRRSDWTDLVPGALLFGAGLAVMHLVSRVYLPARFEHSSALYGSLGIAAVILVWLLVFGQLVVWSAVVNAVWFDFRAARDAADAHQPVGDEEAVLPARRFAQIG